MMSRTWRSADLEHAFEHGAAHRRRRSPRSPASRSSADELLAILRLAGEALRQSSSASGPVVFRSFAIAYALR